MRSDLPYAQLKIEFAAGKLADEVVVELDGKPIARIPTSKVEMVAAASSPMTWRIETIADVDDAEPVVMRTLKL